MDDVPDDRFPRDLTDAGLLRAYRRTTGEPEDLEAETLLDEIGRRGLPLLASF